MKYYKIIVNNTFIGAIHSGQFVKENANGRLFYSNEINGQYVDYAGVLYRDYWMAALTGNREFTIADITEISEEEYNTLREAIENEEPIIIDDDDDEEEPVIIPSEDEPDIILETIREYKINRMNVACRNTIENGIDLLIRDKIHHFSLSTQDQLNLMNLGIMAQTEELIPYHADGEPCEFFTAEEINTIIAAANQFKIYHTTYYNALKNYINSLGTIEDINAITYGVTIPEEYKTDVLKVLE